MVRLLLSVLMLLVASELVAQQINVSTPFVGASDSFHENFGVNFGFSIPGGSGPGSRVVGYNGFGITPNIGFSQNSFGSAIPAFGGFTPGTGARFGFSGRSGNGSFNLGFNFAQGSTRTLSSTTPSVTLLNGGVGSINSGAISPFVTRIVPVVGSGADQPIDNAVTRGIASGQLQPYSERRVDEAKASVEQLAISPSSVNSSAASGDIGVAAIKAQKSLAIANRARQAKAAIESARQSQGASDYRTARIELRKAIKLTDDASQIRELKEWMKTLRGK